MKLSDLTYLRENNRLEVKAAQGRDGNGALPRSVWETVSAFANTSGGTIVLGVEELADGSLSTVGIKRADKVLDDFWNAALSKDKLSARILSDGDVTIEVIDGKSLVVIRVPWANRYVRPVYIDDDLFGGTFRRTHTGDHRCDREEVLSMLRDSDTSSQDATLVNSSDISYLNRETLGRYRRRFSERNENHVWSDLDDENFLCNIGALDRDESGSLKPTRAGLLMFGEDRWITREFPHYFLDYRQETSGVTRWDDRFTSSPGDWSGNLFDFYARVYNKLKAALRVPFRLDGVDRVDDTPAHEALREAIVNALTNANWFERRGIVCEWKNEAITIENPGDFRMPLEEARKPGKSDPRNEAIMRMFSLVGIGERAGSGMDKIFNGWKWAQYDEPSYALEYGPDRTILRLPLVNSSTDSSTGQIETTNRMDEHLSTEDRKALMVKYLDEHEVAHRGELARAAGIGPSWASKLLSEMVLDKIVEAEGSTRDRTFRLKR